MKRFKSARQAQRFLTVHDQVANLFHIPYPESVAADFRCASRERAFAGLERDFSKTAATAWTLGSGGKLPSSAQRALNLTVPFDDIVGHCCDAWNKLINQPWRIMSIGLRDWAYRS